MSGEPLIYEWRVAHVVAGDEALKMADNAGQFSSKATYAALAQAHYLAANVRTRLTPLPGDAARIERLKAMGDPSFGGGF